MIVSPSYENAADWPVGLSTLGAPSAISGTRWLYRNRGLSREPLSLPPRLQTAKPTRAQAALLARPSGVVAPDWNASARLRPANSNRRNSDSSGG